MKRIYAGNEWLMLFKFVLPIVIMRKFIVCARWASFYSTLNVIECTVVNQCEIAASQYTRLSWNKLLLKIIVWIAKVDVAEIVMCSSASDNKDYAFRRVRIYDRFDASSNTFSSTITTSRKPLIDFHFACGYHSKRKQSKMEQRKELLFGNLINLAAPLKCLIEI